MTEKSLPEGYGAIYTFDIKGNRKTLIGLTAANALLFLLLEAPVVAGILRSRGFSFTLLGLAACLVGMVAVIALHELIHGLFFRLFSGERTTYGIGLTYAYAASPGCYYRKWAYMVVGLAPFALISAVWIVSLLLTGGGLFMALYQIGAVHLSGCVGDFFVCLKMLPLPADTLIRDTGDSMSFYGRTAAR